MKHINYTADQLRYKPNASESINRLKAFWQKDLMDHPPIRVGFPLQGVSDELWQKSCEDEATHFSYWKNLIEQKCILEDDDMLVAAVYHGPAFMGGVLGAPVTFGNGTSWNEHILTDYCMIDNLKGIQFNSNNPWLSFMKKQVDYFVDQAQGLFPVGTNLFTGPGDIMGDVRGVTEMYLDMALNPDFVKQLAKICTEAFIRTTQYCFDIIPSIEGGYCDYYSLWTPGRSCMVDDDISVGVSVEDYRKLLFPFDCEAVASMDTPWMHIHSAQIRLVPEYVKIPKLKAIQVVNDWPAGPKIKDIIPMLKEIQKNHCLLLRKFTPEDLQVICKELLPEGLYVDTYCTSLEEAEQFLTSWKRRW